MKTIAVVLVYTYLFSTAATYAAVFLGSGVGTSQLGVAWGFDGFSTGGLTVVPTTHSIQVDLQPNSVSIPEIVTSVGGGSIIAQRTVIDPDSQLESTYTLQVQFDPFTVRASLTPTVLTSGPDSLVSFSASQSLNPSRRNLFIEPITITGSIEILGPNGTVSSPLELAPRQTSSGNFRGILNLEAAPDSIYLSHEPFTTIPSLLLDRVTETGPEIDGLGSSFAFLRFRIPLIDESTAGERLYRVPEPSSQFLILGSGLLLLRRRREPPLISVHPTRARSWRS